MVLRVAILVIAGQPDVVADDEHSGFDTLFAGKLDVQVVIGIDVAERDRDLARSLVCDDRVGVDQLHAVARGTHQDIRNGVVLLYTLAVGVFIGLDQQCFGVALLHKRSVHIFVLADDLFAVDIDRSLAGLSGVVGGEGDLRLRVIDVDIHNARVDVDNVIAVAVGLDFRRSARGYRLDLADIVILRRLRGHLDLLAYYGSARNARLRNTLLRLVRYGKRSSRRVARKLETRAVGNRHRRASQRGRLVRLVVGARKLRQSDLRFVGIIGIDRRRVGRLADLGEREPEAHGVVEVILIRSGRQLGFNLVHIEVMGIAADILLGVVRPELTCDVDVLLIEIVIEGRACQTDRVVRLCLLNNKIRLIGAARVGL